MRASAWAMRSPQAVVDWHVSRRPVGYEAAVAVMERRVAEIAAGQAPEFVWLLEHPPLYTAGTSTRMSDLIDAGPLPVFRTGRGGQLTYHGPGQRVAYLMLDLRARGLDLRAFVRGLEGWLIDTLAAFEVAGERREGRVGVWVVREEHGRRREDKVAALGLRVRRGITFHGVSLNVAPDLSHYAGIVPCGIAAHGVTSLAELGRAAGLAEVDGVLKRAFESRFGPTRPGPDPATGQLTPGAP